MSRHDIEDLVEDSARGVLGSSPLSKRSMNCTAERVTEYVFKQVESGLPEGVTLDRVHLRRTGGELP